jgi:hypothetical protein
MDVLAFEIRTSAEYPGSIIPPVTMQTTVATGMRSPRMQGVPPI